jgi:CBS domain-containing protein
MPMSLTTNTLIDSVVQVRTPMQARELLTCPVVAVHRETSVAKIAKTMVDHRVGCVLVVDRQGKLCGIVTQSDFGDDQHCAPFSMELLLHMFSRATVPEHVEGVRQQARDTIAEKIMVTEVITAAEDSPVDEIARNMLRYDIDHIPIVRDGVPVGVVARHDFLRILADDTKRKSGIP